MERPATERRIWQDYAACHNLDWKVADAIFFPEDTFGPDLVRAVQTAEYMFCGRCPVRAICLEKALEQGQEQYGIRAATTPDVRRSLARTRTRVKCPECLRYDPAQSVRHNGRRLVYHQICIGCGLSWTADPIHQVAS